MRYGSSPRKMGAGGYEKSCQRQIRVPGRNELRPYLNSRREGIRRARSVPGFKEVAEVLLVAPSQEESHQSSVPGMQAPRDPNDQQCEQTPRN